MTTDWNTVMAMTTAELRAYLRTLPKEEADEIRLARLRAARRRYRSRNLEDEQRRQADWWKRKMKRLRENPEELALLHEREAERKRRERATTRRAKGG